MLRRTFLATITASLAAMAGVVRAAAKPVEPVKSPDAGTAVYRDVLIYGYMPGKDIFTQCDLYIADVAHLHITYNQVDKTKYSLVCYGLKKLPYEDIVRFLDAHPRVLPMRINRLSPNGDVQIITTDLPITITTRCIAEVVGTSERGRKIYKCYPTDRNDFNTMTVIHDRLAPVSEELMRQHRADMRQRIFENSTPVHPDYLRTYQTGPAV